MYVNRAQAARALEAAQLHGLDIPPDVAKAEFAARQVQDAAKTPDPARPELPTTPQAMLALLGQQSDAITEARATRRAGTNLLPLAGPLVIQAISRAAPAWVDELAVMFDAALTGFADAIADVPANAEPDRLHHLTAPAFASWQRSAGFCRELDDLIKARNRIATSAGEEGVRHRDLWSAVELPDVGAGREWTRVHGPALRQWHEHLRTPVLRWRALLDHEPFTLRLAAIGEVPARVERWEAWTIRARSLHQFRFGIS